MVPDEDLHRHAAESLGQADALLFGRVTYEMMETAWRARAEIALWLLLYIVPSLLAIFWSRRVLLSGVPRVRAMLARTFLLLGVAVIGLVVLSLVYPHGHHDTLWIPSSPQLSYPIDVAIGFIVVIGALAAWNYPRSRLRGGR
jgi:hypothetical protein